MVFQSYQFLAFFILVFGINSFLKFSAQNLWLLFASYCFYAFLDWRFLGLLILCSIVAHLTGTAMAAAEQGKKKKLLLFGVVFNLAILGFFKYFNFFLHNAFLLFGREEASPALRILLPAGISFYTFKAISYVVDIYRGQITPSKSFWGTSLYLSFFPQIISGPIERPGVLLSQIESSRKISSEDFYHAVLLIAWGLFQKVFVADNLDRFTGPSFAASQPTFADILFGMYGYAFQLYYDFAGYSCMAWGIAKLLGFETAHNFNLPFFSTNIQTFWNRWHISLSLWIRDYLYTPVFLAAGRIPTELRLCLATLVAMSFIGLWHGAAWHFVFYGIYHGALLCLYLLLRPRFFAKIRPHSTWGQILWEWARILFVFHLVAIGFLIFQAPTLSHFLHRTSSAFASFDLHHFAALPWKDLFFFVAPALAIELLQHFKKDRFAIFGLPVMVRAILYIAGFFLITLYGAHSAKEFIYFQF